jgi:hypothetical protein
MLAYAIYLYSHNPMYNGIEKYTNYIYKNKMNKLINKSLWLPNIIKTTIAQYMFYIFKPHTVSISHSQHIIHTFIFDIFVWQIYSLGQTKVFDFDHFYSC